MKLFSFSVILFLVVLTSFAQTNIKVVTKEAQDEFAENVLVYNFQTKSFDYSSKNGKVDLEYTSSKDSVLIFKPGFEKQHFQVHTLQKNNFIVYLKKKQKLLIVLF